MSEIVEKRVTTTYSCGGCDTRWPGVSRCHCGACHRTFVGVSLFDQHRRDIRGKGTCVDPELLYSKNGERMMYLVDAIWHSVEHPTPPMNNMKKRAE